MPFELLVDEAAVLPLRAIAFQSLLLLVAIAIEAGVLRGRLKLGFQPSIRYAASLNLFTTVLGWFLFLGLEPVAPPLLRTQIISYILFGQFYNNGLSGSLGAVVIATGLVIFFVTFWVKAKGLEWLTLEIGTPIVDYTPPTLTRRRYGYTRRTPQDPPTTPAHTLAVLHANAWSFSAILLLLVLRYGLEVLS
ncbi:MAG: hypothetical protein O3A14_09035 [Cyanobacteria bacterium]|nr:hypothetical protein [Cyanobacteriota bacterium]